MAKGDFCSPEKVRRLCHDISNRAEDREKLQILVVRLQQALQEEHYETHELKASARTDDDDPFDKIMLL